MFFFSSIPFSLSLATLIWLLLFTPHAKPEDIKPTKPTVEALQQELRIVKLENLVRREESAVQQVEKLRLDQKALSEEVCKAAGLDPDPKVCLIDLNARTVTKRPPA